MQVMKREINMDDYIKTRRDALRRSRELQEQIDVESLKVKYLNRLGEKFPFQCKCGVTHQFSYIENEEGIRLLSLE
jgi:hypothetical protein